MRDDRDPYLEEIIEQLTLLNRRIDMLSEELLHRNAIMDDYVDELMRANQTNDIL